MRINVIVVGNLKEKYLADSCSEYLKRISRFHSINVIEIPEEKLPKNYSQLDVSKALVKEGFKIESNLTGYVIVLDKEGTQLDSVAFAKQIEKTALNYDSISFVIGSSYGLSVDVKSRANMLLSFSKMTFPHQLFRTMLLEQIYRACTITGNITYHK